MGRNQPTAAVESDCQMRWPFFLDLLEGALRAPSFVKLHAVFRYGYVHFLLVCHPNGKNLGFPSR
jgi:hypothetical protein